MKERRWPWLLSGTLFVAAGLASGYAAYLSSLPCADTVLTYGPVAPLTGRSSSEMSFVCIEIFGGSAIPPEQPMALRFAAVAAFLTGIAWLTIVIGSDSARQGRRLTAPLAGIVLTQAAVILARLSPDDGGRLALMLLTDAALFVALGAVLARWQGRPKLLGVLALGAVSQCGFVAWLVDHVVMLSWTGGYWEDNPPGSGYLISAVQLICGVALLIITARYGSPRELRVLTPEAVAA